MRGVRRLLRSILAFLGAGILLLLMTAQFAPGWRPAPTAPTLNPQPRGLPASSPLLDVEQQAIDMPSVAGGRAWVLTPILPAAAAPVPGVVLVHAAGRGDRNSLLAEARALASSGVAAIVYDKGVQGYSVFSRDYRRLADDAIRAANVLADQDGVDPDQIGIMGWSEGGWVAPTAVQRAPDRFAFMAVASAPVVSPLAQAAWAADRPIAAAPQWIRRIPATVLAAGGGLIDYLDYDPGPALKSVQVPVYAVWGAEDKTVPVNVAVRTLLEHVEPAVMVRLLPETGHELPVQASEWLTEAAQWMTGTTGLTGVAGGGDQISGTEPGSVVGLSQLPASAWFTSPQVHVLTALALAIAVLLLPLRRAHAATPFTQGAPSCPHPI